MVNVPQTAKVAGIVADIGKLSPEVVEVAVALQSPLQYRPGQYVRAKFAGFPAREYSPTCRLDGSFDTNELIFHVRRLPGGRISSQLGATIRPGHRVQVHGPFGHAFLREGEGPLVLVAGGTGWAPIWSLARAARQEQRHRDIVVIAGSRDPDNLYMRPALNWLIDDGVREVIATAEVRPTTCPRSASRTRCTSRVRAGSSTRSNARPGRPRRAAMPMPSCRACRPHR